MKNNSNNDNSVKLYIGISILVLVMISTSIIIPCFLNVESNPYLSSYPVGFDGRSALGFITFFHTLLTMSYVGPIFRYVIQS